ncbi:UDP-3-O-(3-hydroxymyristoyl)glucosamine N-acyltransferase [Luteolibacter ambystomatis]|uniref:UDP-3-O-acylglucosamine N-acyltransferase n=1 Tax=Luteolibacter ambystomatis TaxID=2824561 RepID=A0A975IXY7_9BACT|nr:UDP-3-O-(3-hydroxymyristoyl)glucosamine N-acyltransferase [Luteolibacter ambystomatis]QUE49831.1 UDP-3-O-(3-hydroxymyristoyl)glucosamine N-acyltransferase [Luteolibacter ambystomatis]
MAFALSLSELAQLTGGNIVRGGLASSYSGMAALDVAGAGDISFLGNEKYRGQFLTTAAGAVIVPLGETEGPEGTALIAVENPSLAFGAVVKHFAVSGRPFQPGIHPRAFVDPTAVLDAGKVRVHAGAVVMAGASIGDGSDIGPNVVVGEDVVIGRDCKLHANSTVRERCVLGDRVILQPGAVIGSDGYGYEFVDGRHMKIDQVGIVELGDDVEIGSNTTIDRARFGKTLVGEGSKIDNLVQLAHNVVIGKHCLVIAQTGIAGSSRLGNYVTVAAQVGMVGHVTVGDKAVLAARTGVTRSLEGGITYYGDPALPFAEGQKLRAYARRLPKLVEDVKALKKSIEAK